MTNTPWQEDVLYVLPAEEVRPPPRWPRAAGPPGPSSLQDGPPPPPGDGVQPGSRLGRLAAFFLQPQDHLPPSPIGRHELTRAPQLMLFNPTFSQPRNGRPFAPQSGGGPIRNQPFPCAGGGGSFSLWIRKGPKNFSMILTDGCNATESVVRWNLDLRPIGGFPGRGGEGCVFPSIQPSSPTDLRDGATAFGGNPNPNPNRPNLPRKAFQISRCKPSSSNLLARHHFFSYKVSIRFVVP